MQEDSAEQVAVGRLISSTASSTRRIATLSIGSNYAVQRAQPVRGPSGLIGRVIEIGPTTARILLITDAENLVPVMRASDGLPAFSTGLGNGLVVIKPLNLGESPFKVGDIIVTSGNGGLYQPNIPFARVIPQDQRRRACPPARRPRQHALRHRHEGLSGRSTRRCSRLVAPDGATKEVAE